MATTVANLDGLFKEVYGDSVEDLIPENGKIQKSVPFKEAEKIGDSYHQPVVLQQEHGFTFAAADAGAFALNAAISMATKDAVVKGSQVLLRSALAYDAAAKAAGGGKKSFKGATELLVENMVESVARKLESLILYGTSSTGLGQCDVSVNGDPTHTTLTVNDSQWAPGIWAGMIGAYLDVYATATLKTANAPAIITAIDFVNKKITISGHATDIAAIDTATGGGSVELYWYGSYAASMAGIDAILTNAGSLFGIDASAYDLWKANTSAVGGQLSFGAVLAGLVSAVGRGGLDEKVTVYCPVKAWETLNDDLAALRSLDSSYQKGKGELGVSSIMYHGQSGEIEIVGHSMVKEGEAFALPLKRLRRIGAQDVSFKTPGRSEEIFLQMASNAGFELRCYTDQSIFAVAPAKCVKYTGITY